MSACRSGCPEVAGSLQRSGRASEGAHPARRCPVRRWGLLDGARKLRVGLPFNVGDEGQNQRRLGRHERT